MSEQGRPNEYILGSSARETQRLQGQAALQEPYLRQLFEDAGLGPGMSVLDLGSGAGDVALLAREFVGESGRVVGVERDPVSLEHARSRVAEAGLINVAFIEADLTEQPSFDAEFDAIVGRRVLQYIPTRKQVLQSLLTYLRPGGVVAFQEVNTDGSIPSTLPPSDLLQRIQSWANEARKATGMDVSMGSHLEQLLLDCGLEEVVVREPEPVPVAAELVDRMLENRFGVLRASLPSMREHQVAPAKELDRFEEYLSAIRTEVKEQGKAPTGGAVDYSVWARKPS